MRKNILILGHNYATQFIDIYNQYTRLFDPEKYEVTVAFLTGKPDNDVRQRVLAEQVLFLDMPKKSLRYLKINAIRQLMSLCRSKNFQLVVCHRYKPSYIMLWTAQFLRIPAMVFVMHELKTMAALSRQFLIRCLARGNTLFAGVSNAVRDDIRKYLHWVPKERVIALHNMIDIDLTEPQLLSRTEAREALGLSQDDFIFGHIARLAPNKDQHTLIKAFAHIQPQCPHAKLIIIGDGRLAESLKELVRSLQLEDHIIFSGYLTCAYRYMKAFDCFVLSSIQEAFGRVLLEAMVAEVPIIATAVHGIPEVVADAGILVKPRDAEGMAAAMQTIYSKTPNERKLLGQLAYQHAKINFSIPSFQQQFWRNPLFQTIKDPA